MDANGRQIGTKMTSGLVWSEKRGGSGIRDPDITFGSHGRRWVREFPWWQVSPSWGITPHEGLWLAGVV